MLSLTQSRNPLNIFGFGPKIRAVNPKAVVEDTVQRPRVWSLERRGWALLFFLLVSFLLPCSAQAQGQAEASRIAVNHYAIQAQLFPSTHMLTAKARVDFVPRTDVTSLSFELHSALKVRSVVDANGQPVQFQRSGLNLEVSLLNPLSAGKAASLTFDYGGILASADGSPVQDLKLAYVGTEGSYLLYTGRWFPVNDYGVNRFSASMQITVPPGEVVVASGTAAAPQTTSDGATYSFDYTRSSFPGTVLAGNYTVQPVAAAGANITMYMKSDRASQAADYGAAAQHILAYYADQFGSVPTHHLSIVEIEDGTVGGYSAPGIAALAARGFTPQINYNLMAHEISHQWWRCLVSPATRNDVYLDEGLATYSAAMYLQERVGEGAFEDRMHYIAIQALTHEGEAPVAQAGQLQEFTPEYQSIVFDKGAMVFHMLRWVIGDAAFRATLTAMAKDYAWKTISSDQFQRLAEAQSHQQLTYFFAQWVDSTGVPQFKRTWAVYRTPTGYQVVGKVQQDLDIFRMPVQIRIYTRGARPTDQRLEMVGTTADFTINTRMKPLRVVIDPASQILKFTDDTKVEILMAKGDQLSQEQAYFDAIKQYRQVLEANPNNSLAHYRIGAILFLLRNYNAALEEFREALNGDLQPKWVEVWSYLNIGEIFDVTGQRDRALNEYQRALQTNDNTQGALDLANRYTQKPYTGPAKTTTQAGA